MTFQDVAARVFSLYRADDFRAALTVVEQARLSHPEEDNTITFWQACLLARLGHKESAVETLLAGIERGEWWPTGKLLDHDLDPIRDQPGWDTVKSHCEALTESLMDQRPPPIARNGSGQGTLIAIHGAHGVQWDMFTAWDGATPDRWTVMIPVAPEPTGDGRWEWPHSLDASVQSLLSDLQGLELAPPLILAGFSIGSAIACHLILSTEHAVDGLIAIAPHTSGDFEELLEASSSVRSMIICGDQDSRVNRYRHLETQLFGRGHVSFDLVEGLGHANPADLDRRVAQFLSHF